MQQAQQTYNDFKQQTPKMPALLILRKAVQIIHGEFQTVQIQMTAMGKILPPPDMITVEVMVGQ